MTDIAYARTAQVQWANFSVWLIAAGVVMGGVAALAGIADALVTRRKRRHASTWHNALTIATFAVAIINGFILGRDAWTSVVPTGLISSAITAVLILVTSWNGYSVARRIWRAAYLVGSVLLLVSCARGGELPAQQAGPNPHLPAIQQYLMPPMHVAGVAPWNGAMPKVAPRLRVDRFADGFKNLRSVYVLPNGDVLAVSRTGRTGRSRDQGHRRQLHPGFRSRQDRGGNRITLLRDTNDDGRADLRTTLIEG